MLAEKKKITFYLDLKQFVKGPWTKACPVKIEHLILSLPDLISTSLFCLPYNTYMMMLTSLGNVLLHQLNSLIEMFIHQKCCNIENIY